MAFRWFKRWFGWIRGRRQAPSSTTAPHRLTGEEQDVVAENQVKAPRRRGSPRLAFRIVQAREPPSPNAAGEAAQPVGVDTKRPSEPPPTQDDSSTTPAPPTASSVAKSQETPKTIATESKTVPEANEAVLGVGGSGKPTAVQAGGNANAQSSTPRQLPLQDRRPQFLTGAQHVHVESLNANTAETIHIHHHYNGEDNGKTVYEEVWVWLFEGGLRIETYHQETRERRVEGTGTWILKDEDFLAWLNSEIPSTLWATGTQGTGKTYLASKIIDYLLERKAYLTSDRPVAVIDVYCRHTDNLTAAGILRYILCRLLVEHPDIVLPILKKAYDDHKRRAVKFSTEQVMQWLLPIVALFKDLRIVIDGLDEIRNQEHRTLNEASEDEQGALLRELARLQDHGAHIMLLSRLPAQCLAQGMPLPRTLSIVARKEDMSQLIAKKLGQHTGVMARSLDIASKPKLLGRIVEKISENAGEMILIAALQVESLRGCPTESAVKTALKMLPSDLGHNYEATIRRILAKGSAEARIGLTALLWAAFACRPLSLPEIQAVIATYYGIGSLDRAKFDRGGAVGRETILSACGGLLVEGKDNLYRLCHETVADFLRQQTDPAMPFSTALELTSLVTISHLLPPPGPPPDTDGASDKRSESDDEDEWAERMTLISYAQDNWARHLRDFAKSTDTTEVALVTFLCSKWKLNHSFQPPGHGRPCHDAEPRTCPIAAHLVTSNLFSLLWFLHEPDPAQRAWALQEAARTGDTAVLSFILDEVHPSGRNEDGPGTSDETTAFRIACTEGRFGAAQVLLSHPKVNVNAASELGWTPLYHASTKGLDKIVELLLSDPRVDVNATDHEGWTPLHSAAYNGHPAIAELLLANPRVDVNSKQNGGFTPFHLASMNGHRPVAELLLADPSVDVNSTTEYGWTPFHLASKNGHRPVAELLLADPRVDVNSMTKNGFTPFNLSCENGHRPVAELLLADPRVDIEVQTTAGVTPLALAAGHGRFEVVKLLAERGVNINVQSEGPSALVLAAWTINGLFDNTVLSEDALRTRVKGCRQVIDFLLTFPQIDRSNFTYPPPHRLE